MLASVASMIDLFNMDNIRLLKEMGCTIDVAANFKTGSITSDERVREFKKELEEMGIEVFDTPIPRSVFKIGQIIAAYKMVKKLIEERHYQIVHCHSPIGGVVARLACRNARKNGTKVIYTGHGFHFFKGAPLANWMLFYPVERLCSYLTDVIITINQEDYTRAKSWKSCKVEYVPGIGVHTEDILNEKVERDKMRKEFGFANDDFVFMSTGQVSVRKNHEVIVRAISNVKNRRIKYIIVGFGEKEDYLKNLAKELGVYDRIVFAGYRSDVSKLLHAVDAFAFPSLQEGLPVALMEAMAAGLPVVCSKIRGNVDLIENDKGGFMYDCHDVEGFAVGMENMASNKQLCQRMKALNIENIKRFDVSVVENEMTRIYSKCLCE